MNTSKLNDLQVVGQVMLTVHDMLLSGMYPSQYEQAMAERLKNAMNLLAKADHPNTLLDFPVPEGQTVRSAAEMSIGR